ncbi:MAG: hypothetical protein V4736_00235 [Bdellovibrionota bacterium]
MRFRLIFGFIFNLIFVFSSSAFGADYFSKEIRTSKFTLIFDARAVGSLAFQLDCLAGVVRCEEGVVREFWKGELWGAADDAAISEWARLQDRYISSGARLSEISADEALDIGFPLRHNSVSFDKKFRIAAFLAADALEYRRNLSLLMVPEDVDKVLKIYTRFQGRHLKWWKETGLPQSTEFTKKFIASVEKNKIVELSAQIANFYQAEMSITTPVYFHFFLLPGKSGHSNGEQIENHALVEILEGETADSRIDVVFHELFHYFFRSAPVKLHAKMVKSFSHSSLTGAVPAYNLLNEVLATAFGNGMVAQRIMGKDDFSTYLAKSKSFYNDESIDSVAKALMPTLQASLEKKTNLYSDKFLSDYLRITRETLGDTKESPFLYLRTMGAIYDDSLEKDYNLFSRNIRVGSVVSSSDFDSERTYTHLKDNRSLSGLILITPEKVDQLKKLVPIIEMKTVLEIQKKVLVHKSFIYTTKRSANSWIFILVANPGEEARKLLDRLASGKSAKEL